MRFFHDSRKTVFLLSLICWLSLTLHVDITNASANFTTLEKKLEVVRDTYRIPTVHVALTRNKEVVWAKGLGNQTALDTVFLIASNQKPFVATAVLQLYERGLIDLDTDISMYLPFGVKHPHYPEEPITIQMLLTHTSGLRSTFYNEFYWDTEGKFSSGDSTILAMSLGEYLNE